MDKTKEIQLKKNINYESEPGASSIWSWKITKRGQEENIQCLKNALKAVSHKPLEMTDRINVWQKLFAPHKKLTSGSYMYIFLISRCL